METFETTVGRETFKIARKNPDKFIFNVFNHGTCHTLQRNETGIWKAIEHRFGKDLPLNEITQIIDEHYGFEN